MNCFCDKRIHRSDHAKKLQGLFALERNYKREREEKYYYLHGRHYCHLL